ncbi:MAG TPA: tRNA (adenosine(37)-N6)-dimethylallyltransferase MiaA [Dehalococcoidia bacterium]|nr:tRNA (adenosine(37)-N6)-dimethylallyltransferase MiaA [Dehalococcoidia bacterium]
MSRPVIALVGATASGKTAAAVEISRRIPIEVVSADSRQIRSEMRLGTAAPTDAELAAVPHHLVGIVAPDAPWTLADFLARAREAIEEIQSRDRTPLLIGGTGQYIWALLEGWQVPHVPPNPALRAQLEAEAESDGTTLHARLAEFDPASAERIDARNLRRVIRALEIIEATGGPVPPLNRDGADFDWRATGIEWSREALYSRADERADAMYRDGLGAETRALIDRYGRDFDALRSIGYAEAAQLIDGALDDVAAIERTKTQTHRLIRMQATWFRTDDDRIAWSDGADLDSLAGAVVDAAGAPVR